MAEQEVAPKTRVINIIHPSVAKSTHKLDENGLVNPFNMPALRSINDEICGYEKASLLVEDVKDENGRKARFYRDEAGTVLSERDITPQVGVGTLPSPTVDEITNLSYRLAKEKLEAEGADEIACLPFEVKLVMDAIAVRDREKARHLEQLRVEAEAAAKALVPARVTALGELRTSFRLLAGAFRGVLVDLVRFARSLVRR